MGVLEVGLVKFPDLVTQVGLDSVAALLAQAVCPDVAVVDEVIAGVAEAGQYCLELLAGGLGVRGAAPAGLAGGADAA